MRVTVLLAAFLVVAAPATAGERKQYYGPKQGPFGEGYKHSVEKDGTWRIVTEYHSRDPMLALDVALYRAAELAKEAGKPYVEVLNGYGMSSYNVASGFVYARPSDSAAAPAACYKRVKRCYTAEVAKVLYLLGGPNGDQPGVARPSSVDSKGRQVTMSGMGIGAVAWKER
jgi:hypothetical protein